MTVGYVASEFRKYQYDYPNAFDMIGRYGLSSLVTGIPGSGVLGENQPIGYPMMPTQQVIDNSTLQQQRLVDRFKGKAIPKVEPLSTDEARRIKINEEIESGLKDIEDRKRARRERDNE